MEQIIIQKEYQKLLKERKKIEISLRILLKKKLQDLTQGKDLIGLIKLKLKGGPKDLSSKFDFYLYGRK